MLSTSYSQGYLHSYAPTFFWESYFLFYLFLSFGSFSLFGAKYLNIHTVFLFVHVLACTQSVQVQL